MKNLELTYRRQMRRLFLLSVILALVVVILGAYTRLVHAGLGCPDWPGCYGFLSVPQAPHDISEAQLRFPHAPVEVAKAWAEMTHRYFAGALGLLIFLMVVLALRNAGRLRQTVEGRRNWNSFADLGLPLGLALLVVCQAAFGMWTVTLMLWPQVVTAHLLGGFATLALLWLGLLYRMDASGERISELRYLSVIALAVLILQVALGGWTSSNYAALACPDFPTCQGQWWPQADFKRGFNLWQHIGPNYLGGVMDSTARVAIHITHRSVALVLTLVLCWLGYRLWQKPGHRKLTLILLSLLGLQLGLGISNVIFKLPLVVATAHNGVAALLLLSLITVNYRVFRISSDQIGPAQIEE